MSCGTGRWSCPTAVRAAPLRRFSITCGGRCRAGELTEFAPFRTMIECRISSSKEIAVLRFFAGVASCFLLMTGAFLIWRPRADLPPGSPTPPAPRAYAPSLLGGREPLQAPEAD